MTFLERIKERFIVNPDSVVELFYVIYCQTNIDPNSKIKRLRQRISSMRRQSANMWQITTLCSTNATVYYSSYGGLLLRQVWERSVLYILATDAYVWDYQRSIEHIINRSAQFNLQKAIFSCVLETEQSNQRILSIITTIITTTEAQWRIKEALGLWRWK